MKSAQHGVDVIERVGTVRVAGELRDLPGREVGEDAHGELAALRLQAADLVVQVDLGLGGHMAELFDFGLELGDRLFEVQKCDGHGGAGYLKSTTLGECAATGAP